MKYTWEEIELLAKILEAELAGNPVNWRAGHELALRLAHLYPEIGRSMGRIAQRMEEREAAAA
ncbi:hypothetical protein [Magnetospirillum sp. 15-1]|uniref:hypothetical protein n=1 Tax=Magnetospirillum sp. 15-1 TaxID=1979370 RepID=UPI000BBC2418|nr:hypothetical protein [Magnetospirillum sp. 15-1]